MFENSSNPVKANGYHNREGVLSLSCYLASEFATIEFAIFYFWAFCDYSGFNLHLDFILFGCHQMVLASISYFLLRDCQKFIYTCTLKGGQKQTISVLTSGASSLYTSEDASLDFVWWIILKHKEINWSIFSQKESLKNLNIGSLRCKKGKNKCVWF